MKALKYKIWVEEEGEMFLGHGRAALLEAIDREGSISAAARSMKMSYKKAWTLIDAVNRSAKEPVVITTAGGKDGGGTVVTPYGKTLIAAFETINQNCWEFLDKQLAEINI